MEIKTRKALRDTKKNYKHYSSSDGIYMDDKTSVDAFGALPRLQWLKQILEENDWQSLLDVGCKDGYAALSCARMGLNSVGIDMARDAIEVAQKRSRAFKIPNVSFEVVSIEDYISEDIFDVVLLFEVIDRVIDPEKVMEKCCKLGKNVLVTTPDYYGRFGWYDKKRNKDRLRIYKEEEFRPFCKRFGKIEKFDMIDHAFMTWISCK